MFLFGVDLAIERLFNQTHFVRYFTNICLGCLTILPVKKSDTVCYLIYCVDLGYIWSLKSDLSRHAVLDISQGLCFVVP